MKLVMPLTIIVLIVAAGALGYTIYIQSSSPKTPQANTSAQSQSSKQAPSISQVPGPSQGAATTNQKPPWMANLSAKERSFFNIPAANASAEEKQAFANLLQKNGRTSSGIHIAADCQPSPLIFSLDKTLILNVTNEDSVDHTIMMGENESYSISPASSSAIKIGDGKKGALLSYGCDTFGPVGFLLIAP